MQDSKNCLSPKALLMPELTETPRWFVMRDMKRPNAKKPAYKALPELGFEIFTPMHWVLRDNRKEGKTKEYVPFIHGLLFVKSVRAALDGVVDKTDTLQYRFVKGAQQTPMVVPTDDMERFINAVTASKECVYYSPEEVTPEMLGKRVMIVGGALDGAVGSLITKRGSKKKRLLLQLKDVLVASVEIESGLIKVL